jgi:hypothetical protein
MRKLVNRLSLALSTLLVVILYSLTIPVATAATDPTPDYQRYITFHNDFDFPIYPVIQVPANLCDSGVLSVRRIIINGPGHKGLQPQETLTVLLPNEARKITDKDGTKIARCWYESGRIYIFPVDLTDPNGNDPNGFEAQMLKVYSTNSAQQTQYPGPNAKPPNYPSVPVPCFEGTREQPGAQGSCVTGIADDSFAADVPAQLAEYTFDSDNANQYNDPDTGIPMADIDVSHVDDLYLPITASVYNHGATGYMGGAMDLSTFKQRISNFFTKAPWPLYSAYQSQYQSSSGYNALSTLLPSELEEGPDTPAPHLPGGYNSIQNTLAKSTSSIYKINNGSANGSPGYLISGVTNENTEVLPYVNRWMSWINGNPCANLDQLVWPDGITGQFNKANFCSLFQANAKTIWNNFYTAFQNNPSAFYKDCGLSGSPDENSQNACVIQHIVGYNPKIAGVDLPPLPDRTQRVQALLRGVAYSPQDGSQQYQFDPFLTFTAPYNSQFNLDPYTRLIHSTTDGVGAVAYSFSIDDKYGNFRDASSGFIIDAGGTTALENKQPYDPYQQYKMNWAYNDAGSGIKNNWTKANICGVVDIPINGAGSQTLPLPFANGAYQPCKITITDASNNTMILDMTPESKQVTDTYTGASVTVSGLPTGTNSGSPLITSTLSPTDLEDCKSKSATLLYSLCDNVDVSAVWSNDPLQRDIVYMGLNDTDKPRVNLNLPAAPDLNSGQVIWPYNAAITTQLNNGTALISWPTATVAANSQPPLKYTLYLWQNNGWQPQNCADPSKPQCSVSSSGLGQSASMYVIAINDSGSSPMQSTQLFGCYPAANPCPPHPTGNPAKTRGSKR